MHRNKSPDALLHENRKFAALFCTCPLEGGSGHLTDVIREPIIATTAFDITCLLCFALRRREAVQGR